MKGDISRSTFKREKHYSSVRMQQGRLFTDADWNEQLDIAAHHERTTNGDVIGLCGAPMHNAGFSIQPIGNLLNISAGRYYVDGILCENESRVLFTKQLDFPNASLPKKPGVYLAYLDVWERSITHLDDQHISEIALDGPDTATRAKTIWQVKLVWVGDRGTSLNCLSELRAWLNEIASSTGEMKARTSPDVEQPNPCDISPSGGYQRLENQLYRVEIHKPGQTGNATFKWSRENGSVVTSWKGKNGNDIVIGSLGRDKMLEFKSGDWIELTDDLCELQFKSGTLVRLTDAKNKTLTIDPSTATGPVELSDFPRNPKVRRWDMQNGQITVEVPNTNDGWIPLEDGVEVKFIDVRRLYKTGDYWMIPARTATGDVEWSQTQSGPKFQRTKGIRHHYCRLALLEFTGEEFKEPADCRQLFPTITDLTHLFYISGDGQEATCDIADPNALIPLNPPLQVGVANGRYPVEGKKVRFTIKLGNGQLQGGDSTLDVTSNNQGVAECHWKLDAQNKIQQVEAILLDAAGNPSINFPVRFNAFLSQATAVVYNPSQCSSLNKAKVRTVQNAIDQLCQQQETIQDLYERLNDVQKAFNDRLVKVERARLMS